MITASHVMTVREVAGCRKVEARSIYRLVASGAMRGFKVGGSWRFRRAETDRRTEANTIGLGAEHTRKVSRR